MVSSVTWGTSFCGSDCNLIFARKARGVDLTRYIIRESNTNYNGLGFSEFYSSDFYGARMQLKGNILAASK